MVPNQQIAGQLTDKNLGAPQHPIQLCEFSDFRKLAVGSQKPMLFIYVSKLIRSFHYQDNNETI